MKRSNKNIKIFLNAVLGPGLFIWIAYSIYQQITQQAHLSTHFQYLKQGFHGPAIGKIICVILLMVINWAIEARKWQILMTPLQKLNFYTSVKSVLAGVSLGLNTPNRIGEYGGRMLYIEEKKRLRSVPISMIGNISQLTITLLLGCGGLLMQKEIVMTASEKYGLPYHLLIIFTSGTIIVTVITLLVYFRLGWIMSLIASVKMMSRWLEKVNVLNEVDVTILLRVMLLSALRYFVFVCQYILMLQLMHVELNITDAFWLITVLYLILALTPSVTLLELGLRGMIAVLLFEGFSENTLGIYAASTGIWFVNLIIPAVAGGLFIPQLKIFNNRP